jgi:hypothetical protein
MPSPFRTPRRLVLICSILLATFVLALSMNARAEIQVTGGSEAITVEAKEASVEEMLIALKKAYGLQYASSANLSPSISGTFAGSLQQVVSRVLSLQGYWFIAETSAQGIMVAVYDMSTAPVSNVKLAHKVASAPSDLPPSPPPQFPQHMDRRGLAHGLPLNIQRMRDPHARL